MIASQCAGGEARATDSRGETLTDTVPTAGLSRRVVVTTKPRGEQFERWSTSMGRFCGFRSVVADDGQVEVPAVAAGRGGERKSLLDL